MSEEYIRDVYPNPEFISTLSTSTLISEHVRVDFEVWGCPVDKQQLLGRGALAVVRGAADGAGT